MWQMESNAIHVPYFMRGMTLHMKHFSPAGSSRDTSLGKHQGRMGGAKQAAPLLFVRWRHTGCAPASCQTRIRTTAAAASAVVRYYNFWWVKRLLCYNN